jgi:hypothetical protein
MKIKMILRNISFQATPSRRRTSRTKPGMKKGKNPGRTYRLSELLQQPIIIPYPSLVDITESDDLVRRVVLYPVDHSPEEELATGAASDLVSGKWRSYGGQLRVSRYG